jgi:Ser/Thr protein kinase RdoA (MazF antagonist)
VALSYSDIQHIKEVARVFKIADGEITHVMQVNSGRINSSYKITVTQETDTVSYMLQRINTHVFPNVREVMNNAILITAHLRSKGMETLEYIFTIDGEPLYYGEDGVYRMTKFIHAEIFQSITRPKDMYNLGLAVGQFDLGLSDFETSRLVDSIPNFHNTAIHYQDLLVSAVNNALRGKDTRVKEAEQEIQFVNARRDSFGIVVDAITRGDIPVRVTHNDTKLNNVLFDRKSNVPRCLIDLDTVMRGSALYDIADAIRSGANTSTEEERKAYKIRIDLELVSEFLKGFNDGAPKMLTKKEIALLPTAIKNMPMELGMRYLTDYFDGDIYFGVVNPDDNLVRAKVQLALAKEIEKHMEEIKQIVNTIFG